MSGASTIGEAAATGRVSADRLARRRAPVVVEARSVSKVFRIPEQRIDSLKERVIHPLRRVPYRELSALRDVSFEVHRGEFFGIVGRNGSGKSSLLKILAGIYAPNGGRVRTAGRVAPFIELGVGFNPELTARENTVLNGVLMGLTRREAARRLDAVVDFAELRDFVDLRLKNYSSGMMVRLAFAVMVQADADTMLIDEVLAVGDAAFAQKCMDVFHARRAAGKTVVLVTHDMSTVQALCHRAMVLHDGRLEYVGEPEDASLRYYRLNFGQHQAKAGGHTGETRLDVNARVVRAELRDEAGEPVENVEEGAPISLDAAFVAARRLERPVFEFHVRTADGEVVFEFSHRLDALVTDGQVMHVAARVENRLVPGRYILDCWIRQDEEHHQLAVQGLRLLHFVVYGTGRRVGLVHVDAEVKAVVEEGA